MARRRRGCLTGLFFIVALVLAALAVAPHVPLGWLRPGIEKRLSAAFGRQVSIDSVRLTVFGGPFLTLRGVTVKEDPVFGDGAFVQAGEVRLNLVLADLAMHRKIVVESITMNAPDIAFVKNPNGSWSWGTLGAVGSRAAGRSENSVAGGSPDLAAELLTLSLVDAGSPRLGHLTIDGASVRLLDKTGADPPESLYKNVALTVDVTAESGKPGERRATGRLRVDSSEGGGVEAMKTEMPFNLLFAAAESRGTTMSGSIGPGRLETRNFSADPFKVDGEFSSGAAANTTGKGHISATAIEIASLNVSERLAAAARVAQIGDMSAGTRIGQLETDFTFGGDVVNTANLQLNGLDGLGDASAPRGWFKMKPELTLNYAATLSLSREATGQLKASANPMISAAVDMLANRGGLAVPLNITGDVRRPLIQVDVLRALGK